MLTKEELRKVVEYIVANAPELGFTHRLQEDEVLDTLLGVTDMGAVRRLLPSELVAAATGLVQDLPIPDNGTDAETYVRGVQDGVAQWMPSGLEDIKVKMGNLKSLIENQQAVNENQQAEIAAVKETAANAAADSLNNHNEFVKVYNITDSINEDMPKLIRGTSPQTVALTDPHMYWDCGGWAWNGLNDELNKVNNFLRTDGKFAGVIRYKVWDTQIVICENYVSNLPNKDGVQFVRGAIEVKDGKITWSDDLEMGMYYRKMVRGEFQEWRDARQSSRAVKGNTIKIKLGQSYDRFTLYTDHGEYAVTNLQAEKTYIIKLRQAPKYLGFDKPSAAPSIDLDLSDLDLSRVIGLPNFFRNIASLRVRRLNLSYTNIGANSDLNNGNRLQFPPCIDVIELRGIKEGDQADAIIKALGNNVSQNQIDFRECDFSESTFSDTGLIVDRRIIGGFPNRRKPLTLKLWQIDRNVPEVITEVIESLWNIKSAPMSGDEPMSRPLLFLPPSNILTVELPRGISADLTAPSALAIQKGWSLAITYVDV